MVDDVYIVFTFLWSGTKTSASNGESHKVNSNTNRI